MAYRKTKRSKETLAKIRAGKDRARMDAPAPDYIDGLPSHRRRLIVIDYDFGVCINVLDFYKTKRVDSYRVTVNGLEWKNKIGWSRSLAGLRKSMPRVSARSE